VGLQSLFQHDEDAVPDSNERTGKIDMPYRVWFVVGVIVTFSAIWSTRHYELLAKIAWTITAPGFALSQIWKERHDFTSRTAFAALILAHCGLMQLLFPHLPSGHYGYILLIAIVEIMTIGLAYQVWLHLRSQKKALDH
jgi:hypothetical protein